MKSVNTVTLLGHVTKDPEVKTIPSGQIVCSFGLATNRVWKDAKGDRQEAAEFHNLIVWGKLGEFCGQYVKKGKPLFVTGHLKTHSWENPQKVKLYKTEIIVDDVVLLGAKDKSPETEQAAEPETAAAAA
jgi:single-strand DNA-binding protein